MAGTLVIKRRSTPSFSKALLQPSSVMSQTPWSWETRSPKPTFHMIYTITLCQTKTRPCHTSNRCQGLVPLRSASRANSSSQSLRADTGPTARLSPTSARWCTKPISLEKILPHSLLVTLHWREVVLANLSQRRPWEPLKTLKKEVLHSKNQCRCHNIQYQILEQLMTKSSYNLKTREIKANLWQFNAAHTSRAQLSLPHTQSSHQTQNHSSASILAKICGTSIRTATIHVDLLSNRQSFLDAKMLILESVFTLEVTILIPHLRTTLTRSSKTIMVMDQMISIMQSHHQSFSMHQISQLMKLLWLSPLELELEEILPSSHSDQELRISKKELISRNSSQTPLPNSMVILRENTTHLIHYQRRIDNNLLMITSSSRKVTDSLMHVAWTETGQLIEVSSTTIVRLSSPGLTRRIN